MFYNDLSQAEMQLLRPMINAIVMAGQSIDRPTLQKSAIITLHSQAQMLVEVLQQHVDAIEAAKASDEASPAKARF